MKFHRLYRIPDEIISAICNRIGMIDTALVSELRDWFKRGKVLVFDNGGETYDRYTVLIDEDIYGMSHNPESPQGFNQYGGELSEMCDKIKRAVARARRPKDGAKKT